jgi:hypothetical protein
LRYRQRAMTGATLRQRSWLEVAKRTDHIREMALEESGHPQRDGHRDLEYGG